MGKVISIIILILFSEIGFAQTNPASEVRDSSLKDNVINVPQKVQQYSEKMPEYPGGEKEFYNYLRKEIKYPADDRKNNTEGKVYVRFVVSSTGEIRDVKILRGISKTIDEEALRVIKQMPNWKPGEQDGKKVSVSYTVPLNFSLGLTK